MNTITFDSDRSGYIGQPTVELVFQNENGVGTLDPFVAVYVNGVQHDKVWAYIDREQGADGGWYPVVKFRRTQPVGR